MVERVLTSKHIVLNFAISVFIPVHSALNEMMHTRHLAPELTHGKHSMTVSCYY